MGQSESRNIRTVGGGSGGSSFRSSGKFRRRDSGVKDDSVLQALPRRGESFELDFLCEEELGRGGHAMVFRGAHLGSGRPVAIKQLQREGMGRREEEAVMNEIAILSKLRHPVVVQFYTYYEEPLRYLIVMQLVQGGELFDRIVERKSYNEAEARDLIRICLEAIHYMHSMCIVHRDLKPENLLMLSPHNDYQIVVSDFGLARDVSESDCRDMVGSPYYVAPEVLKMCPHGMAVDIWALGVICFILLGGYPPFHDDNQKKLYQKIKSGKFEFHSTSWSIISDEAKMLISRMLTVDPAERISAKDALRHPWLLGRRRKDLEHHNLDRNLSQLVSFNARRKLRAAIRSVVFAKRMEVLSVDTDDENSSVSSRKSSKVLVSHPSEG